MKSIAPKFFWPGDSGTKKFHNEVAAPAALLKELGIDIEISEPDYKLLRAWLQSKSSNIDGLLTADAGSWNHAHMLIAARAAAFQDEGDILNLLGLQAGMPVLDSAAAAGPAFFLEGEEPRSNDYNPMRSAVYAYFAKRGSTATIRSLAQQVLCRIMGLELLGAVQWTDQAEFKAAKRMWYSGPTLSPVGQRSNKTSNADQLGAFCRLMLGRSDLVRSEREGWECAVLDKVGFDLVLTTAHTVDKSLVDQMWKDQPRIALGLLGNARTMSPFHFVMYPEGLLVWQPAQVNPNTPSSLWSFADHRTLVQTRGFPFNPSVKGRGKGASVRSLGCAIEDGVIIARSSDDKFTARLELPKSVPLWAVDIDQDGARRIV